MSGIVPEAEVTAVLMADKSLHSGGGRQTKARKEMRILGDVTERDWVRLLSLTIQLFVLCLFGKGPFEQRPE